LHQVVRHREAITKAQLEDFKIPVPSVEKQKELVTKIQVQETAINAAQAIINEAASKKQAILKKYL